MPEDTVEKFKIEYMKEFEHLNDQIAGYFNKLKSKNELELGVENRIETVMDQPWYKKSILANMTREYIETANNVIMSQKFVIDKYKLYIIRLLTLAEGALGEKDKMKEEVETMKEQAGQKKPKKEFPFTEERRTMIDDEFVKMGRIDKFRAFSRYAVLIRQAGSGEEKEYIKAKKEAVGLEQPIKGRATVKPTDTNSN